MDDQPTADGGPTPPARRRYSANFIAVGAGATYGVLLRLIAGEPRWHEALVLMSASFFLVVPVVIGVVFALSHPRHAELRLGTAVGGSVGAACLAVLTTLPFALEGIICVAMAAPAFALLGALGGVLGWFLHRRRWRRLAPMGLACAMPFLLAPLEAMSPAPTTFHDVHSQIRIAAGEEAVWREIKSVSRIAPAELPWTLSHTIGLPRPIEATLSRDGIGGVRIASFERGLLFREEVTRWEPGRALAFSIRAEQVPAGALDDHVAVGGPYFDVLDGEYTIERLGERDLVLHLRSRHRLTTGFNRYAGWWSEFVMNDLQQAILHVIRARAER